MFHYSGGNIKYNSLISIQSNYFRTLATYGSYSSSGDVLDNLIMKRIRRAIRSQMRINCFKNRSECLSMKKEVEKARISLS